MPDRNLIKAELQNLQKILEAKADMCIGAGKMKMLSFANACSGALELLKEQETLKQCLKEKCYISHTVQIATWTILGELRKEGEVGMNETHCEVQILIRIKKEVMPCIK